MLDIPKQSLFNFRKFHCTCFQIVIEFIGFRLIIAPELRIRLGECEYLIQEGFDKLLLGYGRMWKLKRVISQIFMNPNFHYALSINIDHILFGNEATKLSHDFLIGQQTFV